MQFLGQDKSFKHTRWTLNALIVIISQYIQVSTRCTPEINVML